MKYHPSRRSQELPSVPSAVYKTRFFYKKNALGRSLTKWTQERWCDECKEQKYDDSQEHVSESLNQDRINITNKYGPGVILSIRVSHEPQSYKDDDSETEFKHAFFLHLTSCVKKNRLSYKQTVVESNRFRGADPCSLSCVCR